MAIIIKDPVDGVVRIIEEQVTKNAVDINNLKVSDSVLASRISSLEAGANLGGANLVRFSFITDSNNYYQLMDDFELVTLPAGWQNGDYIEVHSSYRNDIPAYGYIDGTTLVLEYMGDFVAEYDTLVATNTTRGTSIELTISRYEAFPGSMLVNINADNAKSQIVTVLQDVTRNLSTQYVSFDLNNDNNWSWVYIGPVGTDGRDGFNIIPFSTVTQYNEILANAKAGDTLLDGEGVVFNRGDLKTIVTVQPTVTFSDAGNILGPKGEQGEQGIVGPPALIAIQAITGTEDPAQEDTIAIQVTQLNREAKLGEYLTLIYINTATNNSFMVSAIVTTVGTTVISATVLQAIKITGVQGPQGIAGPAGQSLNIQDGIYIPTTVPVFNTTEEGEAFIVIDTSGQLNTYMLYIHGVGGTNYTVVDNWNGVAGPAPVLTFTSTSTGSGGTSYATVSQTGPGAYTVNLFLASGLNASSVLDNSVGTSITRGYTQAAVNQLVQGDNLLINGDLEINQRGKSTYNTNVAFCIDGYSLSLGGSSYFDATTNTLVNGEAHNYIHLRQKTELQANKFEGKAFTLSSDFVASGGYSLAGGYMIGNTFTAITSTSTATQLTFTIPTGLADTAFIAIRIFTNITADATVKINWLKLEQGNIATPFTPIDRATELLRCQRQFVRFSNTSLVFNGYASSATVARIAIPLPTPMRNTPALTYEGALASMTIYQGGSTFVPSALAVNVVNNNILVLQATTSGLTADMPVSFVMGQAFSLSAEL